MITSIAVNGVKLFSNFTITRGSSAIITLQGYNFTKLTGILLSATRPQFYASLTAINFFTRQSGLTGELLTYTVLSDNAVELKLPIRDTQCTVQFIPFNAAGWSESCNTIPIGTLSGGTTNLVII